MPIISMSIQDDLLVKVDYMTRQHGFPSRSDLIRAALREYIRQHESPKDYDYVVFLALSDHDIGRNIDQRILDVIHRHRAVIKAFYHFVVEGSKCLTCLIIEPSDEDTTPQIATELRRLRGVVSLWRIDIPVKKGRG